MSDRIEFYDGHRLLCSIASAMIPPIGSLISIRKQVWKVTHVTFALDHADELNEKQMRCNVDLEKAQP